MPHPITVLVDAPNFSIRLLTAIPGYSNQFLSPHQINLFIHSFFTGLLTICNKVKQKYDKVDNLVIVWDSKINNRKLIYPNYKGNRKPKTLEEEKDKTNHYSLLDKLRESLKTLGNWANVTLTGFEADDLIAYFVKNSTYENNFVIVSSDNDFFQLIGNRVVQYLPHRKEFYSLIDFKKEFDIMPEKYTFVKALAGDKSDNIKGIDGIGIKKGIKLIKEGKCWQHWINEYPNIDLEINLELIKLPFEEHKIPFTNLPQSYFDKANFIKIFQLYGLNKLNLCDFKQLLTNEKN